MEISTGNFVSSMSIENIQSRDKTSHTSPKVDLHNHTITVEKPKGFL